MARREYVATNFPTKEEVSAAQTLVAKSRRQFEVGSYAKAEGFLNQAILLHPLMPEANILLSRIYLLRGTATHDQELLHQAKERLERAQVLAPNSQEVKQLLQLCEDAHIR